MGLICSLHRLLIVGLTLILLILASLTPASATSYVVYQCTQKMKVLNPATAYAGSGATTNTLWGSNTPNACQQRLCNGKSGISDYFNDCNSANSASMMLVGQYDYCLPSQYSHCAGEIDDHQITICYETNYYGKAADYCQWECQVYRADKNCTTNVVSLSYLRTDQLGSCDAPNPHEHPTPGDADSFDYGCDPCLNKISTDSDGDGHYAQGSCKQPADDCDDNDSAVYPGATEVCDGQDNNCDGIADEGCDPCLNKFSADDDGDGHYVQGSCKQPADDCDDNDSDVYPGVSELCDGKDNNCDGIADEGCDPCLNAFSADDDGDGHYAPGACKHPADDCDENDASVHPGAAEICDGKDNNCDGLTDEGCRDNRDPCLNIPAGSSVNIASGNLEHTQTIFRYPELSGNREFTLRYNSFDKDGPLGQGWTHPFDIGIKRNADGSYSFMQGGYGASTILFHQNGVYTPKTSLFPSLVVYMDGSAVLTTIGGDKYSFDTFGKLTRVEDRNANRLSFQYDSAENLIEVTSTSERLLNIYYNADNRISTITDTNGNEHVFSYSGNTLRVVDSVSPSGEHRIWRYDYDNLGRMTEKIDPMGNETGYGYDDNGWLDNSVDPDGNTRKFHYNINTGRASVTINDTATWRYSSDSDLFVLKSKTDPLGRGGSFDYDTKGRLVTAVNALGETTSYTYDANGNMTSVTDPAVKVTSYTYNSMNLVTSVTDPEKHVTSYTYDAKGNLTSITDPALAVTDYTYDTSGKVTSIKNALNQTSTLTYDAHGNVETITDHTGAVTRFAHDISGNITSMTDPLNHTTNYEYNSFNELTAIRDGQNRLITSFAYDANGNRKSMTDGLGNTTLYEYNHKGKVTKVTDALGNVTTYDYGSTGCATCGGDAEKVTSMTNALQKTTLYGYDLVGNRISTTNPMQETTGYTYDPFGRMKTLVDPAGATTAFDYNNRGLLVTRTDPLKHKTTFSYDDTGRLKTITDRNGKAIIYTYYADGLLHTIQDAAFYTYTYTYDALKRITRVEYKKGLSVWNSVYSYNDVARSVTVVNSKISNTSAWPIYASGVTTITYRYDAARNLSAIVYPGDKTVTYTYDSLNRLHRVADWLGHTATYEYDAAGRPSRLTNFNGTITTWGYDAAGRLASLDNLRPDGSVIASYDFTLDAIGNRTGEERIEPFETNPGNYTTDYTFNEFKNRLLTAGNESASHDLEGQLTAMGGGSFAWNLRHQLAEISGYFNASFEYDGHENRVAATRNGATTRYVYDTRGNLLAETDSTGKITRYYIHGLGLIGMVTADAKEYTYHFNAIGSAIAITDASRNIVNSYSYAPFGTVLHETEILPQPFKFVGQFGVMAEPNGLYYMRARYYDSATGRFISEDPIGFDGGTVNLYEYVGGNPVNWIDPLGLYGTKDCSYYLQACKTNGGVYECRVVEKFCNLFSKNNETSNCIRQCLQEVHKDRQPKDQCSDKGRTGWNDFYVEHRDCIAGCILNPENPYDWNGPDLSDADVRLY